MGEDKKPKEAGWISSIQEGRVSNDLAQTKALNQNVNFKLEGKDELWTSMGPIFKQKYGGTKAYDEFDKYYESVKGSYSQYKVSEFQADKLNSPWITTQDSWMYKDIYGNVSPGIAIKNTTQTSQIVDRTISGASIQGNQVTDILRDIRANAATGNTFRLEDGTRVTGNKNDLIDNPNYVNKDGRQVKGFYYDLDAKNDPMYRGHNDLVAQYYGEPVPLGTEGLSSLDYYGITKPSLESKTWLGAAIDGVWDGTSGLFSSMNEFGESIVGIFGGEGTALQEWFEGNRSMFDSAKTSTSIYAQNNTWSGENMFHMAGEILSQYGTGIGAARGMATATKMLGASLNTSARIGSATANSVMGIHGAGGMRESALQHGYSGQAASWLMVMSSGAMIGLNKSFGLADDYIGAVNTAKHYKKAALDQVVYSASDDVVKAAAEATAKQAAKSATVEAAEEAAKKSLKMKVFGIVESATKKTKSVMVNGNQYLVAGLKESVEETAELATEETIKQIANAVSYAFDDDGQIDFAEGRFMNVTDEGYWEGIGEGVLMSAIAGGVGGTGMKMLAGNKALAKNNPTVVRAILEGKDKEYLSVVENLHSLGKLGPVDLSTKRTIDNSGWEPTSVDNMSMNDANKKLLLQQYNVIKSIVDGFGGVDAATALLNAHPELEERLDKISLKEDISALTAEYVDLKMSNDFDINYTLGPDATEEEFEKYVAAEQLKYSNLAEIQGVDMATIRRAIEIKAEISQIKSGKRVEKYLYQVLSDGKIFDGTSTEEAKEFIATYGPNAVINMMEETEKSASKRKMMSEKGKEKMKENDGIVDGLKDDLSNIEDIESLFDSYTDDKDINETISSLEADNAKPGTTEKDIANNNKIIASLKNKQEQARVKQEENTTGHSPLSTEAKIKLKEKLEKYKPTPKAIKAIKDSILKEVESSGIYTRENISKTSAYKALAAENPNNKEAILDFMVSFYNARITNQVENAKTIEELQQIKVDKVIDIFSYLGDVEQVNILSKLEKSGDAIKFGEQMAKEVSSDPDHDYNLNLKAIKVGNFSTAVRGTINESVSNYKRLEAINNKLGDSQTNIVRDLTNRINEYKNVLRSYIKKDTEQSPESDSKYTKAELEKLIAQEKSTLDNLSGKYRDRAETLIKNLEKQLNNIILQEEKSKVVDNTDEGDIMESSEVKESKDKKVENLRNIINMMSSRLEKALNLDDDTADLDFFLRNFEGDSKNISDTSNISTTIESIFSQINNNILDSGQSTFNDVALVTKALTNAKARKDQLSLMLGILREDRNGNITRTPGLLDALVNMRVRQQKINSKENFNAVELADITKDKDTSKMDKLFTNLFFDPVEYSRLKSKSNLNKEVDTKSVTGFWSNIQLLFSGNKVSESPLTLEEKAKLDEMDNVLWSAFMTQNSLNSYIHNLERALVIAKAGNNGSHMVGVHKKTVADRVKLDMIILDDILSYTGLKGNLINAPEEIKNFVNYYSNIIPGGFDRNDKSDEAVSEDYSKILSISEFLFNHTNDKKIEWTQKVYKVYQTEGRLQDFKDAATMLFHNINQFDSVYKDMLSTMKDVPSISQKISAYYVSAHMNSDVSDIVSNVMGGRQFKSTVAIYGKGGSGKSKMVMGVGARIGQYLQSKLFGKENTKVLLASNHKDQIDIMSDAASNVGLYNTKKINSENGVNLEKLISLLESNTELDDVSTIIYDEATFIDTGVYSDVYSEKSSLDKIVYNIEKINNNRDPKLPKLKLVLMGDPDQNGAEGESGVKSNIGTFNVYSPKKLDHSFRSRITLLQSVIDSLSSANYNTKSGSGVTNIKTEWGIINNDTEMNLYGGVRFMKPDESLSDIISNAQEHINDYKSSGKKFTIGIATDAEVKDPALLKFIKENPDNVRVFTHKGIQGQEFDYVIGYANLETFGNKLSSSGIEKTLASKLATTIGRARYFTAVINETERVLSSDIVDTVTMTSLSYLEELSDKMRVMLNNMIPNTDPLPNGDVSVEIVTTPKEAVELSYEEKLAKAKEIRDYSIKTLNEEYSLDTKLSPFQKLIGSIKGLYGEIIIKDDSGSTTTIEIVNGETNRGFDSEKNDIDINDLDDVLEDLINNGSNGYFVEEEGPTTDISIFTNTSEIDSLSSEDRIAYENQMLSIEEDYKNTVKSLEDEYNSVVEDEDFEVSSEVEVDQFTIDKETLKQVVKNQKAEQLSLFSDEDFLVEVLPTIEEMEETREEIIVGIEEGINTVEDLEKIDNQIILKYIEDETPELEEDLEEGSDEIYDILEEESDDMTEKQKKTLWDQILDNLQQKGILTAYSNNTIYRKDLDISGIDLDMYNLRKIFPNNITPKEIYKQTQLRSMGLRRKEKYRNFTYELVLHNPATEVYSASIVATENSGLNKGNKVIVGNIPLGTYENNKFIGGVIESRVKELVTRNNNNPVSIPINNISKLILDKGKGKLVKGNPVTLSKFFDKVNKRKNPSVFISPRVFVNTNQNTSWAGESFLLYSYDDINDFSRANLNKLVENAVATYNEGDIFGHKAFKNGLGIIRLKNKALSLESLFNMYSATSSETKNFYNIVNSRKGHVSMARAISQIGNIIDTKLDTPISGTVYTNILGKTEPHNLQFTSRAEKEVAKILKEFKVKNPKAYNDFIKLINDMLDDNNLTNNQGQPRTNKKGETWPTFKPGGPILQFASKESLGNLPNPQDHFKFDLMEFFTTIKDSSNISNPLEVLDIFSKVLSQSRTYKNGLFLKPNILRQPKNKTRLNRSFADVKNLPGLYEGFEVNIGDITSPPLYINGDNIVNGNSIAELISIENIAALEASKVATVEGTTPELNIDTVVIPSIIETINSFNTLLHNDLEKSFTSIISSIEDLMIANKKNEEGKSKSDVVRINKELQTLKSLARNTYKKKMEEIDSKPQLEKVIGLAIDNMKNKVAAVVSVEEEISPEMESYKQGLLDSVALLEAHTPFVITPIYKINFDANINKFFDDTEVYFDGLEGKGIITKSQLDLLVGNMRFIMDTLSSKVTSRPEEQWSLIESNLNSTFDNLPNYLEDSGLTSLLISYHTFKNNGDIESADIVKSQIDNDYNPNTKPKNIQDTIDEIVEDTVESKEELESKLYQLSLFGEENKVDVKKEKEKVIRKYKDVKKVDEALNKGEDISEAVEDIKDEKLKSDIKDLTKDTLDDNLSLEGLNIINSTLSILDNFVNSTYDTDTKIEGEKSRFEKAIVDAKKSIDKKLRYVRDPEQKKMIMNMYEQKVNEITDVLNGKIKKHLETTEIINPYIATEESIFPSFKNKSLEDNIELTPGAVDIMTKLYDTDESAKRIWISSINGELTETTPENIKLKGDLVESIISLGGNDIESIRKIIEFQKQKEQDNNCK